MNVDGVRESAVWKFLIPEYKVVPDEIPFDALACSVSGCVGEFSRNKSSSVLEKGFFDGWGVMIAEANLSGYFSKASEANITRERSGGLVNL